MKIKSSPARLICLCIVSAFAFYASAARANISNWTGQVDTDWFNLGNRDNGVPTSSTDAFINSGKARIDSSGATAHTLTIGANPGDSGGLTVDGTNGGSLSVSPACGGNTEDPAYIGIGIYVGYGGSGEMSILNGGTVASGYGYIALLPSDGTNPASNGAVTIAGTGSAWTLSGCPDARLFVGGNNTGSNPGGTALLSVTDSGEVTVNNNTAALVSLSVGPSGTLTGNGTITLNAPGYESRLAAVNGTLVPTGTLSIRGNLGLTPTAMTLFNVTPEVSDMVHVKTIAPGDGAGLATVNGRVSISMTGTFTSSVTRYTLLESDGNLIGTFSPISIKYPTDQGFTPSISYDSNHVYLDLDFSSGGL